jgi:hypothetical protein
MTTTPAQQKPRMGFFEIHVIGTNQCASARILLLAKYSNRATRGE